MASPLSPTGTVTLSANEREAHDVVEQLAVGVKLMARMLNRLEQQTHTKLSYLNEAHNNIDRKIDFLAARQASTLDPTALGSQNLHSADGTPLGSEEVLAAGGGEEAPGGYSGSAIQLEAAPVIVAQTTEGGEETGTATVQVSEVTQAEGEVQAETVTSGEPETDGGRVEDAA